MVLLRKDEWMVIVTHKLNLINWRYLELRSCSNHCLVNQTLETNVPNNFFYCIKYIAFFLDNKKLLIDLLFTEKVMPNLCQYLEASLISMLSWKYNSGTIEVFCNLGRYVWLLCWNVNITLLLLSNKYYKNVLNSKM